MKQFIISILLFLMCISLSWAQQSTPISTGYPFPELQLPMPESPRQRAYLGLNDVQGNFFSPSAIQAQVVLFEFLNVHCPHCKDQAPIYNTLYHRIERDPNLKDKVRIVGVAVGNHPKRVADFIDYYDVAFPMFLDENYLFWRDVGGKTTPFTVYVRQSAPGQAGVVAGTHIGTNWDIKETLELLTEMIDELPEDLLLPEDDLVDIAQETPLPFSEQQIVTKVRRLMARQGIIDSLEKIKGIEGHSLFRGVVERGGEHRTLLAEVVSRSTVCDICHDVHFIYLFDSSLKIIDVAALQLTKYGNQEFDQQDMRKLKQILVGRVLTETKPFNPDVDAVTAATITSSVINHALNQTPMLIKQLKRYKFLPTEDQN
ncbi:TlpA disulfide reductase family protein [Desulfuromonas acetoxidans]|uniref:TlpA family protein disulfide reductase n=1 Tax=Desulfuromonas acetoxidans TaxID=891 RepID=UPI00292D3536|nr:TlpA disulfide reductase family protein [Desulfuromonas acetoxidans]